MYGDRLRFVASGLPTNGYLKQDLTVLLRSRVQPVDHDAIIFRCISLTCISRA